MTRTQMNKIAESIVAFELVIQDPNAPEEKKNEARSQVSQIAAMLARLPGGLETMMQIDMMVENKLANM